MTRPQIITIGSALVLFGILFFGFSTKKPDQASIEKSRALVAESINIQDFILQTKSTLPPNQASAIAALELNVEDAKSDSSRMDALKILSGKWYEFRQPAIAGFYAEKVAEQETSEAGWSITGTTYTLCVQQSNDQDMRDFCSGRAVQAFENAISINPDEPIHRINLALLYTEAPPKENPMQGVLMLRELNEKYPENVSVLVQLGRLGIKTGQYERAAQRLEQAMKIDPSSQNAACLLAEAYQQLGKSNEAVPLLAICSGE